MNIILDTNFLMIPGLMNVDIYGQLKEKFPTSHLFVAHQSASELKKITEKGTGKEKAASKLAIQLMEAHKVSILEDKGGSYADEEIFLHAKGGMAVATVDKVFKERLKSNNIPVITLRQRKYIALY